MKTLVYNIRVNNNDKILLKQLQHEYSIDFRKLYNNLDLSSDKNYLNNLNTKSIKAKEYLVKEVIAFKERYDISKNKIKDKIDELEKLKKLNDKKYNQLVKLKKSYKSKVCFGGRFNLKRRTKNLISSNEWKEHRLYPLNFYGETNSKGNRFFDFKDLSNGNILFKLESTKIKIPISISNKKHKSELIKLQELCLNKSISLNVKLTYNKIYLTFNESILNNTDFNYKLHQKNKPKGLNVDDTKLYWLNKHQEHETRLKEDRLDRYLAIDVNPNEIGFVISDNKLNIIDKGCYKIDRKITENKRKYEYSQIIKDLFNKIKHYKVSYFIIEDLKNLNKDNYGNKISNKKNKLEFKKNYIFSLINRRCNENGIILRKINPSYSSFIGNLMYNEYDPIASSIEICRRGIEYYNKGFKIIPEFCLNSIITDKIDDFVDIKQYINFKELFKVIRNKSYRRKDISFSSQKFTQSDKSHVRLCF